MRPSDSPRPAELPTYDPRDLRTGADALAVPADAELPPRRPLIHLCSGCPFEPLRFYELAPAPIEMPPELTARCPGRATLDERVAPEPPAVGQLRPMKVTTQVVTYIGADGLTIPAFLSAPAQDGRYPAVVYVHGGIAEPALDQPGRTIAAAGFVVLTPGYRGTLLEGMSEGHAIEAADIGHLDVEDIVRGADWLAGQPSSSEQLALFGTSLGGGLVNQLAFQYPDRWDAVVDFFGVSDWACVTKILSYPSAPARVIGSAFDGSPEDVPNGYRDLSPIYHADEVEAAYYVAHGMLDELLPPGESQKWVEALRVEGVEVRWRLYEGRSHAFLFQETFDSPIWQDVLDWMHARLG